MFTNYLSSNKLNNLICFGLVFKTGYFQVFRILSFIDPEGVLEVSDSLESARSSFIYVPPLFAHIAIYMLILLGPQQETDNIVTQ